MLLVGGILIILLATSSHDIQSVSKGNGMHDCGKSHGPIIMMANYLPQLLWSKGQLIIPFIPSPPSPHIHPSINRSDPQYKYPSLSILHSIHIVVI